MARELPEYHRQVAAANREAIVTAATQLFLELGYDRTSLAQVAKRAGVSKATLFKQFPTKAELFEAAVLAAGDAPADQPVVVPSAEDFYSGLVELGLAYAELLGRPQTLDLIRTHIAESPRFPELRERDFPFGNLAVLSTLGRFLRAVHGAGTAKVDDPDMASMQFAGMISSVVFWPRLVHGNWSISRDEVRRVVEEAARTIVARYGAK